MDYGIVILALLAVAVVVSWIFMGSNFAEEKTPETKEAVKVQTKPTLKSEENLMKMTKSQLEEYGRKVGVELDKRKTKKNMVADLIAANI